MSKTPGDSDPAEVDVRRALRSLRVDPPDAGFGALLRERLVAEGPPRAPGLLDRARDAWARWRGRLVWPAAGVLAGAATFALLLLARGPSPRLPVVAAPAQPAVADETVHVIPADKIAVIRLTFTAQVAVDEVAFQVRLPEGLAFWSDGRALPERTFVWRGSLVAGENAVPIAVRGARPGRYRVLTTAEMDQHRVEHAVILEVTGA
jgi:hypothetical protein